MPYGGHEAATSGVNTLHTISQTTDVRKRHGVWKTFAEDILAKATQPVDSKTGCRIHLRKNEVSGHSGVKDQA